MKLLNSNRPGHLFAATMAGLGGIAFAAVLWDFNIFVGAIAIPLWEAWATPDMDHSSRRIWGSPLRWAWVIYWWPYSRLVGHRSKLSHSLLIGLHIRLVYGLFLFWLYIYSAEDINFLGPWVLYALSGCAIADAIHLIKDGYGPIEMFLGK